MKIQLLTSLLLVSATLLSAVPSEINYQGRLTDANGDAVTGDVAMSLKMFDAATEGNEIYSEDIGSVTLDSNGIYSFEFGAGGQSVVSTSETIAITDGSGTSFSGTPTLTPVAGTLSVTDGSYSWNELSGNPGETTTATASIVNGFLVGVTINDGGSGYTFPPVVTIDGNGTDATATAIVDAGVVTAINIDNAGSGYTAATVTVAAPPAPFVVDFAEGTLGFTYDFAPASGTEIVASYESNQSSLAGALAGASSHWLELSVDGNIQSPRERILSVPFASVSKYANSVDESSLNVSTGTLLKLLLSNSSEQDEDFHLVQIQMQPNTVNSDLTSMISTGTGYVSEVNIAGQSFSVSRGTSSSRTINTSNAFVRTVTGDQSHGGNGGSVEITYNYFDGTTASSAGGSWINPNFSKRVSSVETRLSAGGGAAIAGSSLSNVNVEAFQKGSLAINLPEIDVRFSRVFLITSGVRYAGDRVTLTLKDSLQRELLVEGSESNFFEIRRSSEEGDLTAILNCYQSPTDFVPPGIQISEIKLLFLP